MKKFNFIKNAVNTAKAKIASIIANKLLNKQATVITLKEDVTKSLTKEQRLIVASMVDIDAMFKAKKYDAIISLGIINEFYTRGLIKEFIAHFPKFAPELGGGAWANASDIVSEEDLEEYIKDPDSKEFRFFIYHPLGLKVLVAHDFSGFIAAHEKEFRKKAECLMPYFASAGVNQEEYKALLDKVLD
jgi:hypothetical protein